MTASITPSVDVDHLARRLYGERPPEQLRSSERRRQRLERWAQTMADRELSLELEPDHGQPAAVTLTGHLPQIQIPSWEMPQPVTDYDRPAYDYLMQRTLAIHEVGHVRYTDQEAVNDVVEQVDPDHRELFHDIWNALEDGAIEEQLRHEFAVADELAVMNANFGEAGAQSVTTYGMADAIITACLDLAVYDSGRLASLLDPSDSSLNFADDRNTFVSEVLPELQSAAADVVTEADPRARAERVLELWRELTALLDLDEMAPPQIDQGGKGDHAQQESGPGEQAEELDNLDADSASSFINDIPGSSATDADGSTSDADTSDDSDGSGESDADDDASSDDREIDDTPGDASATDDDHGRSDGKLSDGMTQDTAAGDDSDTGDDIADESQSGQTTDRGQQPSDRTENSDVGGDDSTTPIGSGGDTTGLSRQPDDPAETSSQIEEKYDGLVQEQKSEGGEVFDDARREYEALRRALEQIADDGERPRELEIATPGEFRTEAWSETKRNGKQLKRILQRQLQEEKQGKTRRGLRSGRIDPRLLTRIKRRDPRVFRQWEAPDEKDYAAVLILDRSGSMGGSIQATEEASTALAYALSSLAIDTCVIDVGGHSPRLAKPFCVDVEQCLEQLLNGESGGSTPLSPALRLARERLQERDKFPFVIVLTDGNPDNETRYMEELSQCRFPVLGVYINFGGSPDPSSVSQPSHLFDQRRIVTSRDTIETELKALCESVMF